MTGAAGPERIHDPRRILHILQQLKSRRATLAAKPHPTLQVAASTLILDVDGPHARVVLDALFPAPAQRTVRAGGTLPFSTRLDGVAVQGTLRVRTIDQRSDGELIVAEVPNELLWSQRRSSYRVATLGLPNSLLLYQGERHRARMLDLSVGGLGASIATDQLISAGAHGTWELQLPDAQMIAGLRICSAVRANGALRIGGQYVDLSRAQRQVLERAVTDLQRSALKRLREK